MTTYRLHKHLLVLAGAVALASPAWAQIGPGGLAGGGAGSHEAANGSDEPKSPAPPPAIPGAQASNEDVVPASKSAKDLDPNAALFDAIDRGDLTAARDALNRGADLNARNVLGQRPIDMSIDLSRNAITFLLLSMRSQAGDPDETASADQPAPAEPASGPATRRHERHHRRPVSPELVATAQRSGAGSQPSAGFLGFDSH